MYRISCSDVLYVKLIECRNPTVSMGQILDPDFTNMLIQIRMQKMLATSYTNMLLSRQAQPTCNKIGHLY